MEEISELDAARMVTFIYGKELPSLIESVQENLGDNFTVGDVVALIKQDPDAIIRNNENKSYPTESATQASSMTSKQDSIICERGTIIRYLDGLCRSMYIREMD